MKDHLPIRPWNLPELRGVLDQLDYEYIVDGGIELKRLVYFVTEASQIEVDNDDCYFFYRSKTYLRLQWNCIKKLGYEKIVIKRGR